MRGKKLLSAVFLTAAASFAIDFLTKRRAVSRNAVVSANSGISFGFLAKNAYGTTLALSFLAALFIFMLVLYFCKKQSAAESLASALMLGGSLGNLYDRLTRKSVADWFSLSFVSEISGRELFLNAADVFIIAGCALLTLCILRKQGCCRKKHG